jgi:glutathionylspermidine synthase
MSHKKKINYEVGYKKPPKEHQFRKGEPSPNPRGRRKKSRNFAIMLNKFLQEPVTITKNGMKKKMTAQEAIALTMIANAIKGSDKAIERIFKLFPEQTPAETMRQVNATIDRELDALDDEALDTLLKAISLAKSSAK